MAISKRDVLLLYCIKIYPVIVWGGEYHIAYEYTCRKPYFLQSFGLCYCTAYIYMKIEKGGYHHVYSYTQ